MLKIRWMVLALLAAWGIGLTAGLLANEGPGPDPMDGPGHCQAADDASTLLAMGPDGGGPDGGHGGPGGPGGAPEMGPGGGRLLASLGLSQDQKDQLKALRRSQRGKIQAAQNALDDSREDLREMMEKGDASDAQLKAKHAQQQKLQQALEDLRFESILKARAILTPEQRQKAREMMKQGMGKGRRGRGQGGRPQGGDNSKDDQGKDAG